MFPYWFLFGYFAAGSLVSSDNRDQGLGRFLLIIGALLMVLVVGLRYQVGADWMAYRRMFTRAEYQSFGEALAESDPGYQILNWLAQVLGGDLWLVNLLCAIIFSWGLVRFALRQQSPWLAILVAVPYLVIVVAMGYTRQGVAIGLLMAGLASIASGGSTLKFAAYAFAAALFHKTAIFAVPLVMLASSRSRISDLILAVAMMILVYDLLVVDSIERMMRNYIEDRYQSEGAAIRITMNAAPALLFLILRRKFNLQEVDRRIWRNFALAALAMAALYPFFPSSTALDRLALYLAPLQIVVLSRVPQVLLIGRFGTLVVVGYSAAILFVWLNYATHASAWIPYRLFPL